MKIFVKVKTNSKKESVKKIDENKFIISVKESAIRGKANQAIIRVLADYFDISLSNVKIILGHRSRQKIIEIIK